jgi:membrane-anchored glycerophosphoryl diester phosphodiesterase (GDPDase)
MKKLIGTLIVLLSLSFIGILILRIWGIYIVSIDEIVKSGYTLLLLGALIVVLIVAYGAFFKNNSKGYNKEVGNNAHPKL